MTAELWVSMDQIAEHLGVTRDSVYRWIDHKGLPAHRVGRLWKFKVFEVDGWVRSEGAEEEQRSDVLTTSRKA
ncbi:excisionase family DNA-binding protein [Comamonas sp. NoAH]|uniref:excisionase family DNA-binding protein n=1 Tax=Comamonas halotolerans TaxID=3041496 RepID=UPI0024E1562B|nr:excisionase family DNA-binding protein [Comamonas sp. NoAH]